MELIAVFAPFVAFVVAGLLNRQIGDAGCQVVTCVAVTWAALASMFLFYLVVLGQMEPYTKDLASWMNIGDFRVQWALRIDPLSVVMMNVITIVSACVHVYSIGYMSHDPAKGRFMAYLSLFTFAMLMLVSADNLIQLFFGWEGVGLASYLLIGFWNHKNSANAASMKAFIVNRVGDFGLALGIMGLFWLTGSVQFDMIFKAVEEGIASGGIEISYLTIVCLLLFVGAVGKSAQLGLHTWLPDAMEGPTPVSALIHAATMVTAGVFLVARMHPIFEYAPDALMVVTVMGALTAFVAATIGMTQFDIKRVIAYSTMSQLGYMFFALGVGAYSAAMFHLVTHAFFKALLFLGAGSVIHAMSDEQDMRKMGGIWKKIPYTYGFMWIGSLALAGVPFFAGFYSKDLILEAAFADHSWFGMFAFVMGIAAAFMTAFYSWRLLLLSFHGQPRADKETMSHIHESPWVMLVPLMILAVGAIVSGYVFYDLFGHGHKHSEFYTYINEGITVYKENDSIHAAHHVPLWVKLLPVIVGVFGIGLAYVFYMVRTDLPAKTSQALGRITVFVSNKWYFDELYHEVFVVPAQKLGRAFSHFGDGVVINGCGPDGLAWLSRQIAGLTSRAQSGYIFQYAFVMMIGLVILLSWLLYRSGEFL